MNENNSDALSFSNPLQASRRTRRADSIPEDTTIGTAVANASLEELLMRHSSPVARVTALVERNNSPSPLRLNRPRSNPRNRTPMRMTEQEEDQEERFAEREETATQGRNITIRPMAGAPVGTSSASFTARRVSRNGQFFSCVF